MDMTDPSMINAGKNFMNADPVLGSVIVVLMIAISGLVWWVKAVLKEKDAVALAHLADVRKYADELAEFRAVIAANTEQMRASVETAKTMIEVYRERGRA